MLGSSIGSRTIEYIITAQDKASAVLQKFDKNIQANKKSFDDLSKAGIALSAAGAAGVVAITALANSAGRLEQLNVAFTTMLGSAGAAKDMLKKLSDFAMQSPFTLPGVERSAQQLMAVGFNAKEIIPTLKMMSDVASGLSLGEDGLQRLIINLGQVKTQGKLTGREIRDFAVNGVPLVEELAKTLGVAKSKIADLTEAGAISDKVVMAAFRNMTQEGGRFANLGQKQMATFNGAVSNLQDALSRLMRQLGAPMIAVLTPMVQGISKAVTAVGKFAEQNPGIVDFTSKVLLLATAFAAITGPILFAVSKLGFLVKAFQGTLVATQFLTGAFVAMGPVVWVLVGALVALVAILAKVRGAQAAAASAISAEYQRMSEDAEKYQKVTEELSGAEQKAAQLRAQSSQYAAQVVNLEQTRMSLVQQGASKERMAALDKEIALANKNASSSADAVRKFSSEHVGAMAKVNEAVEKSAQQVGLSSEEIANATGAAGDKSKEAAEKIAKAMKAMDEDYAQTVEDVHDKLRKLEIDHTDKMGSIREKIQDVVTSLKNLSDEWDRTTKKMDTDIADTIIDQERRVAELKEEIAKAVNAAGSLSQEQAANIVAGRKDTGGIFKEKLSASDIRDKNLTDDAVKQVELMLQLQNAQSAYNDMLKQGASAEESLASARERANLTEGQRRLQDLLLRRQEEEEDHQKKLDKLNEEKLKLDEQQATAERVYKAQRDQLTLTLLQLNAFHAGYVSRMDNMRNVTEQQVTAMTAYLEQLKKILQEINDVTRSISGASAAQNATDRGLARAPAKAFGGFTNTAVTMVGENGPEMVELPTGSRVLESGQTRRIQSDSGGGVTFTGPIIGHVTVTGEADEDRLAAKVLSVVRQGLARDVQRLKLRSI